MSRRSNTWNAYESTLISPLLAGSTSVTVQSAVNLVPPVYLVVDPDTPQKREWIYIRTINGNNFENIVRDQDGSVGSIDHDAGVKVRAVFTKQVQDDIFEDIEDLEKGLLAHAQDPGDPHANAGYVKESEGDARYVRLNGYLPMTGPLTLWGDPTAVLHAAPKRYVDGGIADHTAIADAHHVKYTDQDAIDATDGVYLPLAGGEMSGSILFHEVNGVYFGLTTPRLKIVKQTTGEYDFYVQGASDGTHYKARFFANQNDFLDLETDGVIKVGSKFLAPDGLISHPSYTFENDETVGMWNPGPGHLGLTGTIDAQRMVLNSTGNQLILADTAGQDGIMVDYQDSGRQGRIVTIVNNSFKSTIMSVNVDTGLTTLGNEVRLGKASSVTPISFAVWQHRNIWIADVAPSSQITGDLWVDHAGKALKGWTGSTWQVLLQGV